MDLSPPPADTLLTGTMSLMFNSDALKCRLVLFEVFCGIFLKVFEHFSRRALASHSLGHFHYICKWLG